MIKTYIGIKRTNITTNYELSSSSIDWPFMVVFINRIVQLRTTALYVGGQTQPQTPDAECISLGVFYL